LRQFKPMLVRAELRTRSEMTLLERVKWVPVHGARTRVGETGF